MDKERDRGAACLYSGEEGGWCLHLFKMDIYSSLSMALTQQILLQESGFAKMDRLLNAYNFFSLGRNCIYSLVYVIVNTDLLEHVSVGC